jgi:hypothetical protein
MSTMVIQDESIAFHLLVNFLEKTLNIITCKFLRLDLPMNYLEIGQSNQNVDFFHIANIRMYKSTHATQIIRFVTF